MIVREPEPEPEYRRKGVTLERKGAKRGLTNAVVLDRRPRGCLFKVAGGFFDLDGYWCVPKQGVTIEVRRGSTKAILRLLTDGQRKELARVRLQARRKGLR